MKTRHGIFLTLTALLAGMALGYGYLRSRTPLAESSLSTASRPAIPPLITTARPVVRVFTLQVPWTGTVEPQVSVTLAAPMDGRIAVIAIEDQATVAAGQLVAQLSGLQVEDRRARLNAEVATLQSQLELARQTAARLQKSLQTHLATRDQVAAAQGAQLELQTRLREVQLNLETLEKQVRITAPINGTFTNRRISAGQDVAAGQVIGDIIDTGSLRIEASLFPPQGVDLAGKEAAVRMDRGETLSGRVQRVLPRAGDTGADMVWIEGEQIDGQLRPGQSVAGSLTLEVRPAALAVPESVIVYDEDERSCLFLQQGDGFELRQVRLGLRQEGWVEVLAGLEKDQSVVTQGAYELFYRRFNEQFKVQD